MRRLAWGLLLLVLCACPRKEASEPTATPPVASPLPSAIPSEPGEAGARAFVAAFMDLRIAGEEPRAEEYLASTARPQFGPSAIPMTSMSYTGWELVSFAAADANSYEVKVRFRTEDEPIEEVLFVGPSEGKPQAWTIRGATRP
jgi:hypothetical protein